MIGLDVGDSRIGVAGADRSGITVTPLCTVARKSRTDIEEVLRIAREREAQTIVVGLPRLLDGSIGEQAEKVLVFVKKLETVVQQQKSAIEIKLWDERFSSSAADRLLQGSKLKNRARRAARDRLSAAIILEGYLDSVRHLCAKEG